MHNSLSSNCAITRAGTTAQWVNVINTGISRVMSLHATSSTTQTNDALGSRATYVYGECLVSPKSLQNFFSAVVLPVYLRGGYVNSEVVLVSILDGILMMPKLNGSSVAFRKLFLIFAVQPWYCFIICQFQSKSTWGEQPVEDIPIFTYVCIYFFMCVTPPGQTKNYTTI